MRSNEVSDLIERMRARGYKVTSQRELIVKEFVERGGHLSAQDVYEEVRRVIPRISLTTVYRTIEMLTEVGILRRVDPIPGNEESARYEVSQLDEHHHHLLCTGCGRIVEFQECPFEWLTGRLSTLTRFKIDGHWLQVFGRCPDCQSAPPYVKRSK